MSRFARLFLPLLVVALPVALLADSNVRIVRFTLVTGAVEVKPPHETQWVPALVNAPVVAGEQIRTLNSGRAEIQFEHGSTLRLIPGSLLTVAVLSRAENGQTETRASLLSGTAFVTLRKGDNRGFELALPGGAMVDPGVESDVRADAQGNVVNVSVLHGDARVEQDSRTVALKKDQQLAVAPKLAVAASALPPSNDPWDKWSTSRDDAYAVAFRRGVTPGDTPNYVNWGDGVGVMPTFSSAGLTFTNTAACPWAMPGGDYQGWCWSSTQGWYLPAGPVLAGANAVAAQDAALGLQGTLPAVNSYGAGYYMGLGNPNLLACDPNAFGGFFGSGYDVFGGGPGCPFMFDDAAFDMYGFFPPIYYYDYAPPASVNGGGTAGASQWAALRAKHGLKPPNKPIMRPDRTEHAAVLLSPPPRRAPASFHSGVALSHTHFEAASFRGRSGGGVMRAGGIAGVPSGVSSGLRAASPAMSVASFSSVSSGGGISRGESMSGAGGGGAVHMSSGSPISSGSGRVVH